MVQFISRLVNEMGEMSYARLHRRRQLFADQKFLIFINRSGSLMCTWQLKTPSFSSCNSNKGEKWHAVSTSPFPTTPTRLPFRSKPSAQSALCTTRRQKINWNIVVSQMVLPSSKVLDFWFHRLWRKISKLIESNFRWWYRWSDGDSKASNLTRKSMAKSLKHVHGGNEWHV